MSATIPVVLSGGSGTRLWPLSRRLAPKQLLALTGAESLLQLTLRRVEHLAQPPLVIASLNHLVDMATQVLPPGRLVGEPVARNTAAAVAVAATLSADDDVLLVMPADHHIADEGAFRRAVAVAVTGAEAGYLVTFGIVPDRPDTGYGYIIGGENRSGGQVIERFVEKPDAGTAAELIRAGALWNSGMFAFLSGVVTEELQRYVPGVLEAAEAAVAAGSWEGRALRLGAELERAPSISIDVAVMERTKRGLVVPLDAGWTDAGSWESLYELGPHDPSDNVVVGDVVTEEVAGSYVRSEGPLVAALGVENLVIVATPDAVLVASRERAQEVKAIVDRLESRREVTLPPPSQPTSR